MVEYKTQPSCSTGDLACNDFNEQSSACNKNGGLNVKLINILN